MADKDLFDTDEFKRVLRDMEDERLAREELRRQRAEDRQALVDGTLSEIGAIFRAARRSNPFVIRKPNESRKILKAVSKSSPFW